MQNSLIFLKSITFYLASITLTLLLGIPAFIGILLNNDLLLLKISKLWAFGIIRLLEIICGLKVKLIGLENLSNQPVIIASKHQSALETLFIYHCLDEGKYVLKDSLQLIPILGTCFKKLNMIFIDRKSAIKSVKMIKEKSAQLLEQGKSVIIFPEGTRVAYGTRGKYASGIASLYELGKFPVIPVALNTGKFWTRNSILKYPGTCFIKFLPAIKPKLKRDEFMEILEKTIESNS